VRHLALAGDGRDAERALISARRAVHLDPAAWARAVDALGTRFERVDAAIDAAEILQLAGQPARALSVIAAIVRRLYREPTVTPPAVASPLVRCRIAAGDSYLRLGRT